MPVTQADTMKIEISQLGQKVDRLFPAIEELKRLVSNTLAEGGSSARTASTGERIGTLNGYDSSYSHHHVLDEFMDHKDILIDSEGTELYAKKSDRIPIDQQDYLTIDEAASDPMMNFQDFFQAWWR